MNFQPPTQETTMSTYGNTQMVGAQMVGALAQTQDPHILDKVIMQLDASLKELHEVLNRARDLGNRLVGPHPEAVGKTADANPRGSCTTSKLEDVVSYIDVTAHELQAQLSRLERL